MIVRRWAAAALACLLVVTGALADAPPSTAPFIRPSTGLQPVALYDAAGNVVTPLAAGGTVTMQDVSVPAGSPFSTSSVSTLFSIDTIGFNSVAVQLSGTYVATVAFEASNDNSTWVAAVGYTVSDGGSGGSSSGSSSTGIRLFPAVARYLRMRVSSYTSGTVVAAVVMRSTPIAPLGVNVAGGTLNAVTTPSATAPGSTSSAVKSAASTNATVLRTAAGNVYDYMLCNAAASARFVKFFNKASAPTVGTDTPFFKIPLAAGQCVSGNFSTPIRFTTGIAYAITGAIGDLDTTATAVDDVTGVINWM